MDAIHLKQRFPNASASFIKANGDQAHRGLSHTQQPQRSPALDGGDARETQGPGCVQVRFILYRCRLLDVDAKYTSVKDLLDCVVAAGFVAGDKEGQIDLKVDQVKVKTKAEERTEIELDCYSSEQ